MPNFNSTLVTAANSALTDGTTTTRSREVASPVLYACGEVVLPSTLAANDTLTLVAASQLPVGAVVDPLLSFFYAETDPGSALTVKVGTAADDDKYAAGLTLNDQGYRAFYSSATLPVGISAEAAEAIQTAIIATVTTATTITNNTVLQFRIAYRVIGG